MVPEEENDGLLDAERHQARHTIAARAQLFPVAEKFVSLNGEGLAAGRPAAFIRFAGCNMWCTYCDTRWANHPLVEVEGWSVPQLLAWVAETGVSCVTLTGGEPLLQPYLPDLVQALLSVESPRPMRVEIETNGSRDLEPMAHLREACAEAGVPDRLRFTAGWEEPPARAIWPPWPTCARRAPRRGCPAVCTSPWIGRRLRPARPCRLPCGARTTSCWTHATR